MTMGRSEHDQTGTGAYNYADRLVAGADVYGSDNEKIGTVADVGQNYFLVQKGWLFIKDLYLPMSAIARMHDGHVHLNLTKHEAETMGREELPTENDAWYGSATRTAGYETSDTSMKERAADTSRTTGRAGENITVPVVEEQLKAGVRETEAGRARIVKDVVEERKTIDVPVQHEEVYVTERAVNRPATEADLTMRNRDIEIPLKQQEVVTQKQAVVTGEVSVRKETVTETEHVTDTVRREQVHVEGGNTEHVHVEGAGMTGRGTAGGTGTTDTAYDRTDMAGDRVTGREGEGIIDRARDALRDGEDKMRNR